MPASNKRRAPQAPRTKPVDIRRQELMEAGARIFLERGIAGASIDEIALAAGVAKGTFYLYFESKEDLVSALRDRFIERFQFWIDRYESKAARDDWRGRLDAWVEGGVRGYLDQLDLHDALFHSGDHHPHHRELHANPVIDSFRAFLDAGCRARAWQIVDTELLAVMIYSAFHGGLDHAVARSSRFNATRFIAAMQGFAQRAIGM